MGMTGHGLFHMIPQSIHVNCFIMTVSYFMQRWLDDSDLDRIMQNYDANNDGEPPAPHDTSSIALNLRILQRVRCG